MQEMGHVVGDPRRFEQLLQHVQYAWRATGFYRAAFAAAQFTPAQLRTWRDLPRLPMVTKEAVLADQATRPPFGTQLAVPQSSLRRIYCSAGSLYLGLTAGDLRRLVRAGTDQLRIAGLRRGDIVDVSSTFHLVMGGTLVDAACRAAGATVIPGGPGGSEQRLRILQDVGATVLQAFTPYAEALGLEMAQKGIDPRRDLRVRLLLVGGEVSTAGARLRLAELWGGAGVREFYGTAETGAVATECPAGGGMHISDDYLFEVIDPDTGEPCDPAGGGEIVLTEMMRRAQPFIRFRTGDITAGVDFRPCPCGRPTPRLQRIMGRRSSILRVKGVFIQPRLVAAVLAECGYGRHQLVVDRPGALDRVRLRIEAPAAAGSDATASPAGAGPTAPAPGAGEATARLVERLKSAIGITCEVEWLPPGGLPPGAPAVVDQRELQ